MMKEIDNLLGEGIAHYAEAMYAIRQFERLIDDISLKFAERRMEDLRGLFGQKKLDGGENATYGPNLNEISNMVPEKWWCWIGRQYWISSRGGCSFFIGLTMGDGKFSPALVFSPQRAPLRDWLMDVLNYHKTDTATLHENWEIFVSEPFNNEPVKIGDVSDLLDRALDKVIAAINEGGGWGV